MEQYQEILTNLSRTIDQNPANAATFAQRGEVYRLMGCYQEALTDFDQAIDLESDYTWALIHRGETYRLMGRYQEALTDFNRALELRPEHAWGLAHRGAIYELMGCYQEALTDFDKAIKLKPDYAWSYVHRGITYIAMRNYEEALADVKRALAFDNTILSSRHGEYGLILNFLGRYNEAILFCEQGLQANSDDHIALYSLAVAKACEHGLVKAQIDIDKAWTTLHTLLPTATNSEERACILYRLGGLAALTGQIDRASNYLQEAISLDNQPIKLARHDPAWFGLQANPRFQALIAPTLIEQQGCKGQI